MPERRGVRNSGSIRLAVEVFRGGESAIAPPIVMLHGGPGGAGGMRTFSAAIAGAPFSRDRDVVIFDQRGAGLSQPKLCPDYDSVAAQAYSMRASLVRDSLLKAARRACVALLERQGIHRDAYTTAENAADVVDLRRALGYKAWIVYGGSYGARLVQELMRRDSAAVIAALLASPAPQAFSREAEQPLLTQRAFERLFAECRSQPTCRDAFPDVEGDFYRDYDELTRSPLAIAVARDGAGTDTVWLDGAHLVADVSWMGFLGRLAPIPLLLHELAAGDRTRAARTLAPTGALPSFVDAALRGIMACNDDEELGTRYRATLDSANALVRAPFRRPVNRECEQWATRPLAPAERVAARSDVPVLIMTGYLDDRTPTDVARRIAATLSHATLVELRDEGHDARPRGCHMALMVRFFTTPAQPIDTSCVARITPIRFATTWAEVTSKDAH